MRLFASYAIFIFENIISSIITRHAILRIGKPIYYRLFLSRAYANMVHIILLPIIALFAVIIGTSHSIFQYLRGQVLKDLSDRHSCGPVKELKDKSWWIPFGLTNVFKLGQADRNHRLPIAFADGLVENGDTYSQRMFGSTMLLTRDPRNIKTLLLNHKVFQVGTLRRDIFWPLLGTGIFTNDGFMWKTSRKLLTPIFKKKETFALNRLEKHAQTLLTALKHGSTNSVPIDTEKPVLAAWHAISTEFLFGEPTNEDAADFTKALDNVLKYLAQRARWSALYFFKTNATFRRDVRMVNTTLDGIIEAATADPSSNSSFTLATLIANADNPTTTRYETLNLLFAARDTSAAVTSWILYTLAREPASFAKLKAEIASVLTDDVTRIPTAAELSQMAYFDSFLAEVLRLFPPISVDGRMCVADTVLPAGGGEHGAAPIVVPTGTFVLYSILGLHRNPEIWGADATSFRPERWSEVGTNERHNNWQYIPFNGGPRKCIGEQLAWRQIRYVVVRMVQSMSRIGVAEAERGSSANWVEDVEYHVDVGMTPVGGARVVIEFENDQEVEGDQVFQIGDDVESDEEVETEEEVEAEEAVETNVVAKPGEAFEMDEIVKPDEVVEPDEVVALQAIEADDVFEVFEVFDGQEKVAAQQ